VTDWPGLYFLGLPWQRNRGSAVLGWVGRDAKLLADRLTSQPSRAVPSRGVPARTDRLARTGDPVLDDACVSTAWLREQTTAATGR